MPRVLIKREKQIVYRMFLKRLFDITLAAIGLVVLFPVFVAVSILIRTTMPGDVFFIQDRVGQYGKLFKMVKFRTMWMNREGTTVTAKGDNRVTGTGRFLRKYKLDEIPELWNILKGEMSFVGPRPDVPGYADRLEGEARKILLLKPGITGPATLKYSKEEEMLASVADPVRYNNEVIYPDKVQINLDYLENQSLYGDLLILWKTVFRKY
jgi:lipopolysaccharide/colanic/teichoic acid biosynthesis glycosyltransferase